MSRAQQPASHRPRRRDMILAAAGELFARKGFVMTGIDEIGAAAGITGPGVYRHFSSKDEILKAVVQQAAEGLLVARETSPIAAGESPEDALRRMVETLVADAIEYAPVAYVLWNESRNLSPQTRAWLTRLHRLRASEWLHVLSRLQPDRSDAELLTIVNGVYGMVIEAVNHTEMDADRTRQSLVEIVLSTLEPVTTGSART